MARRQIFIAAGDAARLTAEVSDPANAGATVVLAPGVYLLSRELELQRDMLLIGAYQDLDGDAVWDARQWRNDLRRSDD